MTKNKDTRRLFICSVSISTMVYAEDEDEARILARDYLEEEISHVPPDASEFTCSPAKQGRHRVFAEKWTEDDVPYGAECDGSSDVRTVGDLFDEEERDAWT